MATSSTSRYLVELLAEHGAGHVKVFGGGGGVIVPEEIKLLHSRGVTRIFSPEDGQELGLTRMINPMIEVADFDLSSDVSLEALLAGDEGALARTLTLIEAGQLPAGAMAAISDAAAGRSVPVLGITGTGGSGKSSLTDELVRRFRVDQQDKLRIAVLAIDPTRRRGGGALLGDRIRMNCLDGDRVFFRSLATRGAAAEVPDRLTDMIAACKASGFDVVVVETPGIGQGDAAIVPFVDTSLYVMTPEFGAASQLEKIDMLDFADAVAINKFERRGAEDARRDVARQMVRNREAFGVSWEDMPVFGTSAATFNDDGVTALYHHLLGLLGAEGLSASEGTLDAIAGKTSTKAATVVPPARVRYLSEIAETVRGYHAATDSQVAAVQRHAALSLAAQEISICRDWTRWLRRRRGGWTGTTLSCSPSGPRP